MRIQVPFRTSLYLLKPVISPAFFLPKCLKILSLSANRIIMSAGTTMKRIIKITFSIILFLFLLQAAAAEELTFVTMNAWSALDARGFFSCDEFEPENDRLFRNEILTSALAETGADVIVLNGLNPAAAQASSIAAELGMAAEVWVSRSGVRFGPVSLPANLKEGDAILTAESLSTESAGRLHLNGLLSTGPVTLFSKKGVQIFGSLITAGDTSFYVFSIVWTESLFDDEKSLEGLLKGYLEGRISADEYTELVSNAVEGSASRRAQASETLSFINSIAGESPVVLMGSFNALPGSGELSVLTDAGFVDVFKRTGRGPGFTIDTEENSNFEKIPDGSPQAALKEGSGRYRSDYIMIRGAGVKPLSAEIVLDEPVYGVYPSNRYGLKAVIEFVPNPSAQ